MKKDGQAVVEFIVAIIAVIVLVAGMIQLGLLQKAHTDVMIEARENAGKHAITPVEGDETPDYVGSWTNGSDKVNYSADDEATDGDTADVQTIVNCANPDELENMVGDNLIKSTYDDTAQLMDGFVNGHSSSNVTLLSAVQSMWANTNSIEVKSDVWMISLGDVY